jgi:hypothetical protein
MTTACGGLVQPSATSDIMPATITPTPRIFMDYSTLVRGEGHRRQSRVVVVPQQQPG